MARPRHAADVLPLAESAFKEPLHIISGGSVREGLVKTPVVPGWSVVLTFVTLADLCPRSIEGVVSRS